MTTHEPTTAPLLVYVLFCETNSGHSDESDGYVHSIYSTQDKADAARLVAMDEAIERDAVLYWDERTMGKGEENCDDWEEDYTVHTHHVL